MNRYRNSVLLALSLLLSACAQFRTAGDYQGIGPYATGRVADPIPSAPTAGDDRSIGFRWPVNSPRLTQPYSPANNPKHQGIDIGGHKGMPILSAAAGKVIYAGRAFRGYGNMVLVEHRGGWATLYAHLHRIKVRRGQNVDQGQTVGTMGRTGRSTGVHLHFEVMRDKQPVDPLIHLDAIRYFASESER